MRYIRLALLAVCLICTSIFVACHKKTTENKTIVNGDVMTATGQLEELGPTTFMYGTHKLLVDPNTWYLLESTTIDLNTFVGRNVTISAVNTHYHAEQGPEMYNVTSVIINP